MARIALKNGSKIAIDNLEYNIDFHIINKTITLKYPYIHYFSSIKLQVKYF